MTTLLSHEAPATMDGFTRRQVLAYANALKALGSDATICAATDDRLNVLAAVVSCLSGGPRVILPSALSSHALVEVYESLPFTHWFGLKAWQSAMAASKLDLASLEIGSVPEEIGQASAEREVLTLFTGGSTGRPKVWTKRSSQLMSEVRMQLELHQIGPRDRVLATVSPHHIYGLLFSVLIPWLSGACFERKTPFFPEEITSQAKAMECTILVSTPAHLRALASVPWTAPVPRIVLCSGAPLDANDSHAFHARVGRWPCEVYGSTETGGVALRTQEIPQTPWRPLPGVEWKISDEHLCVRSNYLSNNLPLDNDGFFSTADRAVRTASNGFLLQGRSDSIVKIGGERVDMCDIESRLMKLDAVRDVAVFARSTNKAHGHELVALIASDRSKQSLTSELRSVLPPVAWPRRWYVVDEIPTNMSGKRDRATLDAMLAQRALEETSEDERDGD